MKYFKIFVVIGLSISLFINLSMLSRMNHLENQLLSLSSTQSHLTSMVNSQTGNIRNAINEIKKEQSWLGYVTTDVNVSDPQSEEAQVAFEWQIKEITEQAKVQLHFRMDGQETYSSVEAEETAKGIYSANIVIPVTFEPEWNITFSDNKTNSPERHIAENIENEFYNSKGSNIHYYISVSSGGASISSDQTLLYLNHLGSQYYGSLQVTASINNRDHVYLSLYNQNFKFAEGISLDTVYLKRYSNGVLAKEIELLPPEDPYYERAPEVTSQRNILLQNVKEEELYDRFVLHVVYSDGAEFEKGFFIR